MHTSSTKNVRGLVVGLVAIVGLVWASCDPGGVSGTNRNTQCDDGTTPTCEMVPPTCAGDSILAHQNNCYVCVDPDTCDPTLPATCNGDTDCAAGQWCDPCGASSCPGCLDCRAACVDHDCVSDGPAICRMVQPECGDYGVAVVRDGCWVCVEVNSCETVRDEQCDDGTDPTCNMIPPDCAAHEILAYQNECYVCVNAITCVPWGEAGCTSDADCAPADACDPCASGSCPSCPDCVAGCLPHGCPTEPEALCYMERPECATGEVAVVQDGCWVCVDEITCQ